MKRLNLGCGVDVRPEDEGWVNMDAFYDDVRVLRHDLVQVPWPFADATFDHILASHVLEHTPPIFRERNGIYRDALFEVMEEAYRVLRPGGRMEILVPVGERFPATTHPQHYRRFEPESFAFFCRGHPERYISSAAFEFESWDIRRGTVPGREAIIAPHALRLGSSRLPLIEHIRIRAPRLYRLFTRPGEIRVVLRKPLDA